MTGIYASCLICKMFMSIRDSKNMFDDGLVSTSLKYGTN